MKLFSVFDPFARRLCAVVLFALTAASAAFGASDPGDPHGVWRRPDGGEQFSFYDCDGGLLCARLVAVAKPEDAGAVGTVILRGASKSGPNEWKGKLYNARDGKIYEGYVTLRSANELRLKGCLWGFLCGGETWTRVAAAAPATKPRGREAGAAQAQ
ncbi:DUF2147 domain-containing protein [Methylocystis sp. IM3]|jgi:uncharacterized protein (DUF2147 family)|uniref:DUF2147 domain-containing protein n=1 Tax=unclassified Methylocystis TaxID=2625913 RepID=UPI000FA75E79|nr:MAG: DUF2147 domain-containing protein [Hyphomicrobiales bacterium]